jgi:hypothetical protein
MRRGDCRVADVVGLPGVVIGSREADPVVVEELEKLLADARSGIIAGLAYAAISSDGMVKFHWDGAVDGNAMAGAVSLLQAAFNAARLAAWDEEE